MAPESESIDSSGSPLTALEGLDSTKDGRDTWEASIVALQRAWLKNLQQVEPDRPIKVQHYGNDDWHIAKLCSYERHSLTIHTRGLLSNEIVFDLDYAKWEDVRDRARKLASYLQKLQAPFVITYTGGKGIHLHLFLSRKMDFLGEALLDELKDQEIDIFKVLREAIFDAIVSELDLEVARVEGKKKIEGLDRGKVSWSMTSKGSQIRMFGSPRPDGRFKTLVLEVPEEKPSPGPMPSFYEKPPEIWDFLQYQETVKEAMKKALARCKTGSTRPVEYSGELRELPCCRRLLDGLEEGGRDYGALTLAMFSNKAGLKQEEAKQIMEEYNSKCSGMDSSLEKTFLAKVDYVYRKGKMPSCSWVDENLKICRRSDCPLEKKRKEEASFPKETKTNGKVSIDERLKKEAEMKKLQNQAEPFIYPDGRTGFYIPDYGPDCIRSLDEWATVFDKSMNDTLEDMARHRDELLWLLPSAPDPSNEDPMLLEDLVSYIKGFVEFPQEWLYYCFAAWILSTYITEKLSHAPRWIVSAPTEHGKGRNLKMAQLLAYRAILVGDPTVAVLYRFSGWYRATVLIDEIQDLQADQKEVYGRVMGIFKLGFDVGTVIPRMNNDNSGIDGFKAYSFMMVAAKRFSFKEDEQNRAIMITMRKRTRPVRPDPMGDPIALAEATALRTRLHAFRIRALQGIEDIEVWKQLARCLVNNDVWLKDQTPKREGDKQKALDEKQEPKAEKICLEDRSKEKALSLLLPCMKFGHDQEVLAVVAEAQKTAKMEQSSTMAAQVFSALQCLMFDVFKGDRSKLDATIRDVTPQDLRGKLESVKTRITVALVRDQLVKDLINGNACEEDLQIPPGPDDSWKKEGSYGSLVKKYEVLEARYKTKTIGTILRQDLGFDTKEGTGNKAYITAKRFKEAYASALLSFGSRYGIEDTEN